MVSGTATNAVSILLALAVARKDSGTGRTQRSRNLIGNVRNATRKENREAVSSFKFCDVVSS